MLVDSQVDSSCDGPGEASSHVIVLSRHMADVRCELRDVGQLALLTGRPRLINLRHRERQWLVVHEN